MKYKKVVWGFVLHNIHGNPNLPDIASVGEREALLSSLTEHYPASRILIANYGEGKPFFFDSHSSHRFAGGLGCNCP